MTEKRFAIKDSSLVEGAKVIVDNKGKYTFPITKDESTLVVYEKILVKQDNRIKELESENKMLKTTISRNNAYINQIKTSGKWSNTGECRMSKQIKEDEFDGVEYIMDKVAMEDRDFAEFIDVMLKIFAENEELKKELKSFRPLYFKSEDGCVTLYEKVV